MAGHARDVARSRDFELQPKLKKNRAIAAKGDPVHACQVQKRSEGSVRTAPRPKWKRLDYLQDDLSAAERARTDEEGGTVTLPDYMAGLERGEH